MLASGTDTVGDTGHSAGLSRRRAGRAGRRTNGRRTLRLRMEQLSLLLVVLGGWQLYAMSGTGDPILVKSPSQVYSAFLVLVRTGELWGNLGATLEATMIALLLGSSIGIVLGVGLALTPRLEEIVDPYIDALNAMPRIALAPVFIIYFGIGLWAKVALAFSLVVFVMLISARAGVQSADRDALQLITVLGSSRIQKFTKVLVPVALPSIFGGLRLGLIYSLLGVVSSELISSPNGLGQVVASSSSNLNMAAVYAVLIVLAIVAALFNSTMKYITGHLLRWQPPADH